MKLPDQIDLGNPADSAFYARASHACVGQAPGDTLTMRGAPILFALTIPLQSANRALAEQVRELYAFWLRDGTYCVCSTWMRSIILLPLGPAPLRR